MCLLYLFVNPHPKPDEYLLVLASVRDEFFGRPTSGVHIWENNPQIVGPMDLEEGKVGGTWLGMNITGKVASLLNIIQPLDEITGDEKLPRGHLAVRYLEGGQDGMSYLRDLRRKASDYDRFLLVTLDVRLAPPRDSREQAPTLATIRFFAAKKFTLTHCSLQRCQKALNST